MRYLFLKPSLSLRLSGTDTIRTLSRQLHRWRGTGLAQLLLIAAALLFQACFTFGLNTSSSLPHTLYLIHKGAAVSRGELVAFRWHGGGPYAAGVTFIKVLSGLPGDTVSHTDRQFFVNGVAVGHAKRLGRDGSALEPGSTGVIPSGHYYVSAPHPDSLDSRYRLTGWISHSQIIGRAYGLF